MLLRRTEGGRVQVLEKLRKHSLKCRPTKCKFEATRVKFLGVEIGENHLVVSPAKVQAIRNEKLPRNKKMLRRFLGMTEYHQKFIQDYARIAKPLHDLMKDVPYEWKEEQQVAFEQLKDSLTMAPVLSFLQTEGPLRLETDASGYATGPILSQYQEGAWRTLGYTSKGITGSELNYTTYNKEMLRVMRGLEEW
jgi:hypothetical protein